MFDRVLNTQIYYSYDFLEIGWAYICEDSERDKDSCPLWKNSGACENMKDTMKMFCPKTCDLCSKR